MTTHDHAPCRRAPRSLGAATRALLAAALLPAAACQIIVGIETTSGDGDAGADGGPGSTLRVTSTLPPNGAADVPVDAPITASFSQTLDASTISGTTFTVDGPGGPIQGTVSADGRTATFTPAVRLPGRAFLTARIAGVVTDVDGNRLGIDFSWTFETGLGTTDVNAALEYTVRDIPVDGVPDVFVGGTPPPPLLFIKSGTEDRAVVEFPLAAVPQPFQSATLEFEVGTLDPGGSSTHIEIYVFDANGVPDLSDFIVGQRVLFADFFGPNTNSSDEPRSFDAGAFVQDAQARGRTHLGFMFRAVGTDRYDLVTSSEARERAPRLRVIH